MDIKDVKNILGTEFSYIFDVINPVIQDLNLDKDANILDVGTGRGRMVITLAFNQYKVLTGEPESDESEYAKQNWINDARKVKVDHLITFKHFNAEKMPFNNDFFDAVFMFGALHHINDKALAIKECVRVTKPKGYITIFEPTHEGLKYIRKQFSTHPDPVDPRHLIGDLQVEIKEGAMFNTFIIVKD